MYHKAPGPLARSSDEKNKFFSLSLPFGQPKFNGHLCRWWWSMQRMLIFLKGWWTGFYWSHDNESGAFGEKFSGIFQLKTTLEAFDGKFVTNCSSSSQQQKGGSINMRKAAKSWLTLRSSPFALDANRNFHPWSEMSERESWNRFSFCFLLCVIRKAAWGGLITKQFRSLSLYRY